VIKKVIHQTWSDTRLPQQLGEFHLRVREMNPDCEVRLWTDRDIDAFVRTEFREQYSMWRCYAMQIERVDAWRYMALYRLGGMYLDLDMEPCQPFAPLFDHDHDLVLALEHPVDSRAAGRPQTIAQAVMLAAPENPFLGRVIDRLRAFAGRKDRPLGTTGPTFLTAVYDEAEPPEGLLLGHEAFFPVCFGERFKREARGTFAVHRMAGTWRPHNRFKKTDV
jgi:mannosyltransferase OCH1-like enzyme